MAIGSVRLTTCGLVHSGPVEYACGFSNYVPQGAARSYVIDPRLSIGALFVE